MSTDIIRIELAKDEAAELTSEFDAKGIEYSSSVSKQLTGEQVFLSIIVPATLTVAQIVTAYLQARKPQQSKPKSTTHIEVNRRYVKTEDFSVEVVEEIIDHHFE